VRFELTEQAHTAVDEYFRLTDRKPGQFLFAGRGDGRPTLAQVAPTAGWSARARRGGPAKFGMHSLRPTKAFDAVLGAIGVPEGRDPFGKKLCALHRS
jgi:integrase